MEAGALGELQSNLRQGSPLGARDHATGLADAGQEGEIVEEVVSESGEPVVAEAPEGEVEEEVVEREEERIVTPTLGEIYAAQGQYAKAIGVFEILSLKHPERTDYRNKIALLKEKLQESRD